VKVEKCRVLPGTTVRDAMEGVPAPPRAGSGIFGEVVNESRILEEGDRIELYDELPRDPKRSRRERAGQQRSRR